MWPRPAASSTDLRETVRKDVLSSHLQLAGPPSSTCKSPPVAGSLSCPRALLGPVKPAVAGTVCVMRTTMSHHVPQHIIPSPAARCEMNCARSSFCFVERASLVANREFKIPETCQHAACASRATRTAQNTTHSFAPSCSCIDRHAHALAREIDSTAAACLISSVGCFLYTCISDPASTTNVSGRSAAATPRLAADDRRNWLTHAMQPCSHEGAIASALENVRVENVLLMWTCCSGHVGLATS